MTNLAAGDQLRAFIERVERLEEEKRDLQDGIGEVYKEAKANGFNVKAIREIVRKRKQNLAKRQEHEAIVELYMASLGEFVNTPLGKAALDEATS